MTNELTAEKPLIWWKDKKLLAGFILVLLSIILGTYGKVVFIARFYEPIGIITGISIWVFSWILLFFGIFLVGWETVKMIQQRIHHHVRETVKGTYHHAKELPRKGYNYTKKGYHYTKKLHKKGMDKITKTSKGIVEKIKKSK